jgi:hypothetical protein
MGQIDELVSEVKEASQTQGSTNKKEKKSPLSIISLIIEIVGLIFIGLGLIFLSVFIQDPDFDEQFYIMLGCIVGGLSLLFYGLIGKCLDDIRNNTKK